MAKNDGKPPRWLDQPAPGFGPNGESMIQEPGTKVKWPEQKVVVDGVEMTVEEYEKRQREAEQRAEDLGSSKDLDELDAMIGGGG